MLDTSSDDKETALLLRPIPTNIVNGKEPVRFGGKPRLPEQIDWPGHVNPSSKKTHYHHFVAEIDLAALSRVASDGKLPKLPDEGTLYIFLPLDGDMIYGFSNAEVRYWPEAVSDIPEREPPENLASLIGDDWSKAYHVHQDGTTDGGKVLVRQFADALPFMSSRATNPLVTNLEREHGKDVAQHEQAGIDHEDAIAKAFQKAEKERPFPHPPEQISASGFDNLNTLHKAIPRSFLRFNSSLEPHHLDWSFIFDWSRNFYLNCCDIALGHFQEMLEAGYTHFLLNRRVRQCQKKRDRAEIRVFGKGRKPIFRYFSEPAPIELSFDYQALRWMALSQFETGYPSEVLLRAFVEMLVEIDRHGTEEDDDGYSLGLRVGLLDHTISGHDKHAGNMFVAALEAFSDASKDAEIRHKSLFGRLPQDSRWDSRIIHASDTSSPNGFSLGTMPLQMFGQGFEIQSAVTDHAKDVLLMQFGDSFGLPLEFGPDMIVQLWISPEDLAAGQFNNVSMTQDMT
ncbi:DUF1963 domain-containing protein [Ruegeria sp.]|uniref:DUF1963 domain-containing protein n=1 Tax=Ruegeria sp. TaxID=1879320 RepID=UPI0023121A51|nr:DUF1963 domain-containing protein [Ruegeria sp.]MDA7966259.1 DUF1963 domain-containing protein [Ruegeria sp.]